MPLLKNGKLVDDPWTHVADEVAIPASGPVIVGLKRWREERAALIKRKDPVGVRLQSAHTPGDDADDLEHLGVVALAFPVFKAGRAYTNARRLRERMSDHASCQCLRWADMGPLLADVRVEQRSRALKVTPNQWAESITDQMLEIFESGETDTARAMLIEALENHDTANKG